MVNKVILVGRLGQDPQTRYTGSGDAVCNFSLATSERFKDKFGEQKETTEWHRIVIWRKQAEIAQQYLHKGSLVFVEGKIQSHEYDARDGSKKTAYEIVASNFRMLEKKESASEPASSENGQEEFVAADSDVGF
jgi:single-strand DNA-binding protein